MVQSAARIRDDSPPFVISRTFDVPRSKVFAAFTEADRMRKWWGPKTFECILSKIDLRPGGSHRYALRAADGTVVWGKLAYREIEPPERLVFITMFTDESGNIARHPMVPTWPLELMTKVFFEETNGQTTVTVEWSTFNPTQQEQATFDGGHDSMKSGWTGTLDQLESYLSRH